MNNLIILATLFFTLTALTIWLLIAATERCLTLVDILRETAKQAALDAIQVWSAGHMAAIDIERERTKFEFSQEYAQFKLHAQRKQLQVESKVTT